MTDYTHHPDCMFWFENYQFECSCSLTVPRPAWSVLVPWPQAALDEWRAAVLFRVRKADTPNCVGSLI